MMQEQVKYLRDAIPMMRDAFIAKLQEFSQLPEETWQKIEKIIELRCVLVNQFPKRVDQYAIIDLLGLNGAYVLWDRNPNNTWHSIIKQVGRSSYPELIQACMDLVEERHSGMLD